MTEKCPYDWHPTCCCSVVGLEPSEKCEIHGVGDRRFCPFCKKFRYDHICKSCGCSWGLEKCQAFKVRWDEPVICSHCAKQIVSEPQYREWFRQEFTPTIEIIDQPCAKCFFPLDRTGSYEAYRDVSRLFWRDPK